MGYKDKTKMTEYNRQYYLKHKERELERNKLFVAANRDRVLQNKKENHKKNAEKERKQKQEWYNARQVERIAYSKEWQRNNPERTKETHKIGLHNRRAAIRNDGGKLSRGLERRLLDYQNGKCPACRKSLKDGYELDHIMPIALGGKNQDNNIQLLCVSCNRSKHAKHPIEFMQYKGFLL